MDSILFKNIQTESGRCNIFVRDGLFADVNAPSDCPADTVVDGTSLAIIPALYNTHTHAAMIPMRGGGEGLSLQRWLEDYVWPYEDKMTSDDIASANRLAVKEMTASGTVFFSDMYFDIDRTIEVVAESGIRAAIGLTFLDGHSKCQKLEKLAMLDSWKDPTGGRITLTIDPHAIYTAGPDLYGECLRISREKGLLMHTHLAETKKEVDDCVRDHGMTPVRYLDSLGVLGPNVIAAHCVWVDEEEWDILAERGVTVSHCPCSNMKLGSGRFPYELAIKSGVRITLGTDGASSNNNLDLREEMKFASLLAKVGGDSTILPAKEVFAWASRNGAEAFGINGGEIADGKVADAVVLDMTDVRMQPCNDLISNWVYSADSSCVRSVLCGGRIVFEK